MPIYVGFPLRQPIEPLTDTAANMEGKMRFNLLNKLHSLFVTYHDSQSL